MSENPHPPAGSSVQPGTAGQDCRSRDDLRREIERLQTELAEARKTRDETSERLHAARAVAYVSRQLVSPNAINFRAILAVLGETVGADRCHILRFDDDGRVLNAVHNWSQPGAEIDVDPYRELAVDHIPWFVERVRGDDPVAVGDIDELPDCARKEREILRRTGAGSLMIVPMMRDGSATGLIAAVARKKRDGWSDAYVHLFRSTANILDFYFRRVEMENALRESEQWLRLITENSSDTIWTTDMAMNVTYVSPSVERIRGFTPAEAIAQSVDEIFPPDSLTKVVRAFSEEMTLLSGGEDPGDRTRTIEIEEYHKDGSTVPLEITLRYLRNEKGEAQGIIGVSRDISARRRAEDEKRALEGQLRQSQKMEAIGTLAGGIAHDFNNVLVPVIGHAELAKFQLDDPDSPINENLDEILVAAKRARDLVGHILAFAREREDEMKPIRLESIADETIQLLTASLPTATTVHFDVDAPLPAILGDPAQIHQVLMNLCVNASGAMPAGGDLRVALTCVHVEEPVVQGRGIAPMGEYVRLSVTDSGMGIDPKDLPRIFDPYFTTKGVEHGGGMGLAVVHGIVRSHGGFAQSESERGIGTTIHIYLPAIEEELCLDGPDTVPCGDETILVVDDEPSVARLVGAALEAKGYTVIVRATGEEALATIQFNPDSFDLLITDQSMPGVSGRELAARVREAGVDIPIVLCTGFSHEMDPEKARQTGIDALILKPILGSELCRVVRKLLDRAAGARDKVDSETQNVLESIVPVV